MLTATYHFWYWYNVFCGIMGKNNFEALSHLLSHLKRKETTLSFYRWGLSEVLRAVRYHIQPGKATSRRLSTCDLMGGPLRLLSADWVQMSLYHHCPSLENLSSPQYFFCYKMEMRIFPFWTLTCLIRKWSTKSCRNEVIILSVVEAGGSFPGKCIWATSWRTGKFTKQRKGGFL